MSEQLYDYRSRLLGRLESIAAEVAEAIAGISESRWHEPVKPAGRSPHAIIFNLHDLERRAYILRLRRILSEDSPVLEALAEKDHDSSVPMTQLLAEYKEMRSAELELLSDLPPAGWTRIGRHPAFGLRTVLWWAERILEHSKRHLQELRGNEQ